MGDSQKLIVVLLVLAILFSVASIVVSMCSDVNVEIPEQGFNVVKLPGSGGSGIGLAIENGGSG